MTTPDTPATLLRTACAVLVLVLGLSVATPAQADYDSDPFDPVIARDAWMMIAQAERAYNIPAGLLHAMSLVETGQGIRGWVLPWPYTINVNGSGIKGYVGPAEGLAAFNRLRALGFVRFNLRGAVTLNKATPKQTIAALAHVPAASAVTIEGLAYPRRFNSAAEAAAFAHRLFAQGYTNIDVGMMQINWRVHGHNFRSVEQAIEPHANLRYAVSYLLEHRQTRDWWGSVGRYHSGTSYYANRYIRNVYAMYLRIHRVNTTNAT